MKIKAIRKIRIKNNFRYKKAGHARFFNSKNINQLKII